MTFERLVLELYFGAFHFGIRIVLLLRRWTWWLKRPQGIEKRLQKPIPFSYHMEYKKRIKASCNNNIHIGEKVFCSYQFWRFVSRFFSDRLRKCSIFGLYDSSLNFQGRQDQMDTVYEKQTCFSLCKWLVWCTKV